VDGDRLVATGSARTAAIWSLCVSKANLVTHILDIENHSDQIDPFRSMPVQLGGQIGL
jgi:hypothetical protein